MRQLNPGQVMRVVLVHPMYAGNIGAVVRLCLNFGVGELVIVSDKPDRLNELLLSTEFKNSATAHGLSWFNDGLAGAKVRACAEVSSAVGDCSVVVGFSRRTSGLHRVPSLAQSALSGVIEDSERSVALVFGREDGGLTNDDLRICTHLCSFDVDTQMPSLNLSHAVAVALSCISMQKLEEREDRGLSSHTEQKSSVGVERATVSEIEVLVARWSELLESNGVSGDHERSVAHFRRVLQKSDMTSQEFGAIRAVLQKLLR